MSDCGFVGRNANVAIKKESAFATYITPDIQLRPSSEGLIETVDHTEDPALISNPFSTDFIKVGITAGGAIETKIHPDTAGIYAHWTLGGENAVANPPNAWVVVYYNGTSDYARLTKTADDLLAEDSSDGSSWAADTNFNTTGTIDVSTASFDTASELATAIDGYTGWSAYYVGAAAGITADIADFTATTIFSADEQVAGMKMGCLVTSTVAKLHDVFPAETTTCLPSYTVQINRTLGTDKSVAYVGSKMQTLAISVNAADLNGYSATLSSVDEEEDKTDVSLTVPTFEAYSGLKTRIFLDELELTEVTSFSANVNNALDETKFVGDDTIDEQIRQGATADISITALLSDPTNKLYSKKSKYTNSTPVEITVYMEAVDNADNANSVPFSAFWAFPRVKLTAFNAPAAGPDRIAINVAGNITKPIGSDFKQIEAKVVDQITATY